MNEVSAIIELPVLMLHCPKCKWRFPVKLPAFAKATKEGGYISCAACGQDYEVRVELLVRDAQLRIGADDAGQGGAVSAHTDEAIPGVVDDIEELWE